MTANERPRRRENPPKTTAVPPLAGFYPTLTKDNVTRRDREGAWLNPWEDRLTTLEERCRLMAVPPGT